jgi:ubiquinone/menaquinone biosynthesis C-methylase UbiE
MDFKDHFSKQAFGYSRYRPTYPGELFEYLASLCAGHDTAWDCGAGSGQAAVQLADFFQTVIATDPSKKQIANAIPHTAITYRVARAEDNQIPAASVDLITVAQAVHWFDFDKFYVEARRVLKPGGVIAVWSYSLLEVSPEIDRVIRDLYVNVVGSYWPPERRWIDEGYRTLPFPFKEIIAPSFSMISQWDLAELMGYLHTWSALQRFMEKEGYNPIDQIFRKLQPVWGDENRKRKIHWPFHLRVGIIENE